MRTALFVPCYVDQLAPDVGFAALELLARHGVEAEVPRNAGCCGQALWNLGDAVAARARADAFVGVFGEYDHVVAPSASCVDMVRHHFPTLLEASPRDLPVLRRTRELCEFLVDVLGVERVEARFPHRVGLQIGCHGLRGLGLGRSTEQGGVGQGKVRHLLSSLDGIELVEADRRDECCGFGGSFSVLEGAVSRATGRDRLADFEGAGAEVVVTTDVSCGLHLGSLITRQVPIVHIAEALLGREPGPR